MYHARSHTHTTLHVVCLYRAKCTSLSFPSNKANIWKQRKLSWPHPLKKEVVCVVKIKEQCHQPGRCPVPCLSEPRGTGTGHQSRCYSCCTKPTCSQSCGQEECSGCSSPAFQTPLRNVWRLEPQSHAEPHPAFQRLWSRQARGSYSHAAEEFRALQVMRVKGQREREERELEFGHEGGK